MQDVPTTWGVEAAGANKVETKGSSLVCRLRNRPDKKEAGFVQRANRKQSNREDRYIRRVYQKSVRAPCDQEEDQSMLDILMAESSVLE